MSLIIIDKTRKEYVMEELIRKMIRDLREQVDEDNLVAMIKDKMPQLARDLEDLR